MKQPTAAIIIIGNEILSGRTQDVNVQYIARGLVEHGIRLCEVRFIPDDETIIVETVNLLRADNDYVFTTGGIGPTHDDITSASVAKALGLELTIHPEAYALLEEFYAQRAQPFNDARRRMAMTPEGASLIANPLSAAPGFIIDNVYVMAGIPNVMQKMFDSVIPTLSGSFPIHSRSVTAALIEGDIADDLARLQHHYPDVEIGSYPSIRGEMLCVSIVIRSHNVSLLDEVEIKAIDLATSYGGNLLEN